MNVAIRKIREITEDIEKDYEHKEIDLSKFTECLFDISLLRGDDKSFAIEAFACLISKIFNSKSCLDISELSVYNLFKSICTKVLSEDYVFDFFEAVYIKLLISVGNEVCLGRKCEDTKKKELLTFYYNQYRGIFEDQTNATYIEIMNS